MRPESDRLPAAANLLAYAVKHAARDPMNKGQKLVKMLELMTRRGGVRSQELLERFEIDQRSLRRYLADLRELDLPVKDEGRGDDRLVTIDSKWRRTGVQLSLAEVLSLHFGRTLFNFLEGTSFAEDIEGAIERLEPAISRTHRDLARQLDTKFLAVPEPAKDYRSSSEVLDELVTAVVYNTPLEVRYRTIAGLESNKLLHPYTLATFRQGLYLFALDVESGQIKTYAVERFTDVVRRRGEHFVVPVGWRPAAHLANAFGIISGPPEHVVVAFDERAEAYVRERTWHPTQTFRTRRDGRLELHMDVAVTVELQTWIQGFGAEVEVIAPDELRANISAALKTALDRYRT